ncbi:MAG TPA: PKD domain-containing protein [Candidatus Binataceae bacterium]|nr:PKD domain-containing protein [Candidatus Binataceae bacterium]
MSRRRAGFALCAALALALLSAGNPSAQDMTGSMPMQQSTAVAPGAIPPFHPLQIPHPPRVTLEAVPGYGPAPLTVGFLVTAGSDSTDLVSYRWDLGDGTVSTLPPAMLFHTYSNPGSYVVTLSATTADGHTALAYAGVTVSSLTQAPTSD